MTKREICERLMEIRDQSWKGEIGPLGIREAIRLLLLDLDAPETEEKRRKRRQKFWRTFNKSLAEYINAEWFKTPNVSPEEEEPKEGEKHPGVLAKPGKDGEIEWCWCQKCYAQAAVVHDPFGDGENWSYCQKCGASFRLKHGEGEK